MKLTTAIRMDIQDLLNDKSFCQWVHKGCEQNSYWGNFYIENVHHRSTINNARNVIESIGLASCDTKKLFEIWNRIADLTTD